MIAHIGADDYLVKPVDPAELLAAIAKAACAGRRTETRDARKTRAHAARGGGDLLGRAGKTNPEIATILGIGLTTVKKHLEATFAKLGVENRTSAAAMALENLR